MTRHSIFMAVKAILLIDPIINAIVNRAAKNHGWAYADSLDDKLYSKIQSAYTIFTK